MMLVMEVESRGMTETMLNRIPWRSFGVKTLCQRGWLTVAASMMFGD
jgi:hypothetical protein